MKERKGTTPPRAMMMKRENVQRMRLHSRKSLNRYTT
jgi:hypothetical protein